MIIAHVYHPILKPKSQDKLHPDYTNSQSFSIANYKLVCEYSDYVKNNDVILYETGGVVENLNLPLDTFFSKELLDKIKNKEALLAIDTSYESRWQYIEIIYENMICKQGIPAEQIYVIGHSLDYTTFIPEVAKKHNQPVIGCEFYPLWCRVQQGLFTRTLDEVGLQGKYENYKTGLSFNTSKKFLYLNNNWMSHRLALLSILNNRDLLKYGHNSFNQKPDRRGLFQQKELMNIRYGNEIPQYLIDEQTNTVEQNWKSWMNEVYEDFPKEDLLKEIKGGYNIHTQLPLQLDQKTFDLAIAWFSQKGLLRYYRDSYFSIITETFFLNKHPRHPTEKLFKAISHKHPFVYIANKNALESLTVFGYQTYDGIINESYDKEPDDCMRMLLMANEIQRLCNLNEAELQDFKNKSLEVANYNYNKFLNHKNWIVKLL